MRRLSLAAAAVLIVAGSVALVPAAAHSSPSQRTIKVIQYNAADGTECSPHGQGCLAAVNNDIAAHDPDVIGVEEVCESDAIAFAQAHGLNYRFVAQTNAYPGCDNGRKGNMLASKWALSNLHAYKLGHPESASSVGAKTFTLLCGGVAKPNAQFRACVTHLRAKGGLTLRRDQMRRIVRITAGSRSHGQRVIVAGDFNVNLRNKNQRPALKVMTRAGFLDTDPVHRPTHGPGKIDYVWFFLPGLVSRSAIIDPGGQSDHRLLVGFGKYNS